MVADTLLTEAYEVEGVLTGLLVVVGSRPPSRSPPKPGRSAERLFARHKRRAK
jgi:hypothetical protein